MNELTMVVLALADKHHVAHAAADPTSAGWMRSSSWSCMNDAVRANSEGRDPHAQRWALRSLAYSVGVLHPDYVGAEVAIKRADAGEDSFWACVMGTTLEQPHQLAARGLVPSTGACMPAGEYKVGGAS